MISRQSSNPVSELSPAWYHKPKVLQIILSLSIILLGFVGWQAIDHTASEPPEPSSSQSSGNVAQDETELKTDITRLQAATESGRDTTEASLWWIVTIGLLIHTLNVIRTLRKIMRARQSAGRERSLHGSL